jgi:hypothetical protein
VFEKSDLPALTPSDLTGRQTSVLGRKDRSEKGGIYVELALGSCQYPFRHRRQSISGEFGRRWPLPSQGFRCTHQGVACSSPK